MNTAHRHLTATMCMVAILVLTGIVGSGGCDLLALLTAPAIDPNAAPSESYDRGVRILIRRASGNREAQYVEITPGQHGGMFGTAIHLYENGQLVYARFQSFATAIGTGNNHVASGQLSMFAFSETANEDTQTTSEDATLGETSAKDNTEGNIRTTVAQNTGTLWGYHVNIYVDDAFIITLYKDCNTCSLFDYPTADARARSHVSLLQGWTR